jgi:hypothetical protein
VPITGPAGTIVELYDPRVVTEAICEHLPSAPEREVSAGMQALAESGWRAVRVRMADGSEPPITGMLSDRVAGDEEIRAALVSELLGQVGGEPVEGREREALNMLLSAGAAALMEKAGASLADLQEKGLGPFARRSRTSREGALANYPRQGDQRHRIVVRLWRERQNAADAEKDKAGLTREQIANALGLSGDAVRPRVLELIKGGWARVVPGVTRETRGGNEAEVIGLTDKAVERITKEGI